jgi:hypothetical protein
MNLLFDDHVLKWPRSMLVVLKESMVEKAFLIYNRNSQQIKEFVLIYKHEFPTLPPNKTNQLRIGQQRLEPTVWVV